MQKLREALISVLNSSTARKSVAAEADLILYHFFRDEMKSASPIHASPEIESAALEIARKRATGIPLQHLLGYQFFYEHEYQVSPAVLIPRPETEILVQAAISWVNTHGVHRFAELGLGSGAISGELLSACPGLTGVASEVSEDALKIARINLNSVLGENWSHRLKVILSPTTAQGFEVFASDAPFDLILSNPPYVSRSDEIETEVLEHEPHLALFADADDSSRDVRFFYLNFIEHAAALLSPTGAAFFEIPHERAQDLLRHFNLAGMKAEVIPDLTGRSRVLKCTF